MEQTIMEKERQHDQDEKALMEMRKIIEIEGLLEKYQLTQVDSVRRPLPKNNYSGLNSLRARLRNRQWNGDNGNYKPQLKDSISVVMNNDTSKVSSTDYFALIRTRQAGVGAPVLFFFKLGTAKLVDASQVANAKEIAKVMLKYGLSAKVIGRADSATGTTEGNKTLSSKRAAYITSLLKQYGVRQEDITAQYAGGVDTYTPAESNRNTSVVLYMK